MYNARKHYTMSRIAVVNKYTMHWEALVEIMDSEVAGIALFSEGRSPEENSAYFCHRGIHNFTSASKQCMIYLFYIPPTNRLKNNKNVFTLAQTISVPRWTRFTQWSMRPIPISLFTHYRWKTIDRSHIYDDIDGIVHYSINVVTV